jgi:hypothetical protein
LLLYYYYFFYFFFKVLAGLGLKTEEFSKAFQRFRFNLFVQVCNFGFVSSIVYGVSQGLAGVNAISLGLAAGMAVCTSLLLDDQYGLGLDQIGGGGKSFGHFQCRVWKHGRGLSQSGIDFGIFGSDGKCAIGGSLLQIGRQCRRSGRLWSTLGKVLSSRGGLQQETQEAFGKGPTIGPCLYRLYGLLSNL